MAVVKLAEWKEIRPKRRRGRKIWGQREAKSIGRGAQLAGDGPAIMSSTSLITAPRLNKDKDSTTKFSARNNLYILTPRRLAFIIIFRLQYATMMIIQCD